MIFNPNRKYLNINTNLKILKINSFLRNSFLTKTKLVIYPTEYLLYNNNTKIIQVCFLILIINLF